MAIMNSHGIQTKVTDLVIDGYHEATSKDATVAIPGKDLGDHP